MAFSSVWGVILQIGSISGLLSLVVNVVQNVKKTPCFRYEFSGSNQKMVDDEGKPITVDGLTACDSGDTILNSPVPHNRESR